MSAVRRTADRLPGRTPAGKAACVVGYVALAGLFGGAVGLALAVVIVVSRWAFALPARYFWIGALGALGAAPIATIAQGLPGSSVVGPEFGEHHLAAHFLVGASLALAAFAGLLDADRTHWRPPANRRGATAGGPAAAGASGPQMDAGADANSAGEPPDPGSPVPLGEPTESTRRPAPRRANGHRGRRQPPPPRPPGPGGAEPPPR